MVNSKMPSTLITPTTNLHIPSTIFSGRAIQPAHAVLSDGRIVLVWSEFNQSSDRFDVFTQLFDENMVAIGAETRINSYTLLDQIEPSIAALANGGYVISWMSAGFDPANSEIQSDINVVQYEIVSQVFDATGNALNTESVVNTSSDGTQSDPLIVPLADGGYLVVWHHRNYVTPDENGESARFQRYDEFGVAVGAETTVPATALRSSGSTVTAFQTPSVVQISSDRIAFAWEAAILDEIYLTVTNMNGELISQTLVG